MKKFFEKIINFIIPVFKENAIDYAVVAPDDPLVLGCVDALEEKGIPCFGPTAAAVLAFLVPILEYPTSETGPYGLIMNILSSLKGMHRRKPTMPQSKQFIHFGAFFISGRQRSMASTSQPALTPRLNILMKISLIIIPLRISRSYGGSPQAPFRWVFFSTRTPR